MPVLIEFEWPGRRAVPAIAGKPREPVRSYTPFLASEEPQPGKKERKVEWWRPFLPLLAIVILLKLATWFVNKHRR
ncbi:hypothetical protein [Thermococcus sp.]|uniref:hypothetical protein n=1 Tax=Thermococcus sp. TaxID=35749 RepID=UPI0025E0E7D0|nr:hypothetical protein [Thermococcus sp.]